MKLFLLFFKTIEFFPIFPLRHLCINKSKNARGECRAESLLSSFAEPKPFFEAKPQRTLVFAVGRSWELSQCATHRTGGLSPCVPCVIAQGDCPRVFQGDCPRVLLEGEDCTSHPIEGAAVVLGVARAVAVVQVQFPNAFGIDLRTGPVVVVIKASTASSGNLLI